MPHATPHIITRIYGGLDQHVYNAGCGTVYASGCILAPNSSGDTSHDTIHDHTEEHTEQPIRPGAPNLTPSRATPGSTSNTPAPNSPPSDHSALVLPVDHLPSVHASTASAATIQPLAYNTVGADQLADDMPGVDAHQTGIRAVDSEFRASADIGHPGEGPSGRAADTQVLSKLACIPSLAHQSNVKAPEHITVSKVPTEMPPPPRKAECDNRTVATEGAALAVVDNRCLNETGNQALPSDEGLLYNEGHHSHHAKSLDRRTSSVSQIAAALATRLDTISSSTREEQIRDRTQVDTTGGVDGTARKQSGPRTRKRAGWTFDEANEAKTVGVAINPEKRAEAQALILPETGQRYATRQGSTLGASATPAPMRQPPRPSSTTPLCGNPPIPDQAPAKRRRNNDFGRVAAEGDSSTTREANKITARASASNDNGKAATQYQNRPRRLSSLLSSHVQTQCTNGFARTEQRCVQTSRMARVDEDAQETSEADSEDIPETGGARKKRKIRDDA